MISLHKSGQSGPPSSPDLVKCFVLLSETLHLGA